MQKYRIFLRRVSDASYKIQYSHKGLSRNLKLSCESSRIISPPSTLIPSTFTKLNYQNRPLQNLEASSSSTSSSLISQSRLLSGRGNWQSTSIGIGSSTLISRQNDLRLAQSNYGAHASIQGHLAKISLEDHPNAMSATLDSNFPHAASYDVISSFKNLTYQTNYAGYSISNIKNFTESRQSEKYEGLNSCPGITKLPSDDVQCNDVDHHVGDLNSFGANNDIGQEQFGDVIADYRVQLPSICGFENGGEIQESIVTPLFDMSEFDVLSAQHALDLGTTLPNQITIHNQAQVCSLISF